MQKIIPLIFSVIVFYTANTNAQAVGGWGNCEFATVAAMNAFDPSTNAFDCKKVFVQATDEHYHWDGTIWVLDSASGSDDQIASEVPFTPVSSISATDVQAAITEIEPDIYGTIDVHSDVDVTTITPSSGDVLSWDGANFVPSPTDNGYTIFNVFAEESAVLSANSSEWSFGNGDETPTGHGIIIPIDCELFAMSLDHENGVNTTVRIIQNSNTALTTYQVVNTGTEQSYTTFPTPLAFSAGDVVNFRTISRSADGLSGRVSAWFRIRATPASNSLVNDMLDVSAGTIAAGDILSYNGGSFVPLTLNAANVPYDNSTSGLTATDVKAALDELAGGSSSDNIYSTDGTLATNRIVNMNGLDLTFNSGNNGNFYIEGFAGSTLTNSIFELDRAANRPLRFFHTNDATNGYWTLGTADGIALELDGLATKGIYLEDTGNVGIGTNNPRSKFHIFETVGTPASATAGTIFLEHQDDGGSQSIVFESGINTGNDYAYIEYSDDGTNGTSNENSLLEIGVQNDGVGSTQDHIALMPSGRLGVGTTTPNAFFDVNGGTVRFSDYGGGGITGTATKLLAVNVDGDIIQEDLSTFTSTDDQTAAEVPFTPVGTIVATDVQAAIAEIEPDIYGSVGVHSDVDVTTITPSSGDVLSWDGANFVPSPTDNGYTVFSILAEEQGGLGNNAFEWGFGSADATPNGHGVVIPVDCELFAMSLDHENGVNTTVRVIQNSNTALAAYQVVNTGTEQSYNTFPTPLAFSAGDVVNFRTISRSNGGNSGRVAAWFRIRATPASNSLVNDMLDVSAGAIAAGDVLYFNGGSFVPLTLNATNIPYDNATSGLTATDVKAALDELASSTGNIYTTNGTLGADRTVTMNGRDLTFESGTNSNFLIDGFPTSNFNNPIFEIDRNTNRGLRFYHGDDTNSGYWKIGTNDGIALEVDNTDGDGIYLEETGDVGIGTSTPDAKLDVEGGTVRLSDYGGGAVTGTLNRLLGIEADGDVIEIDPSIFDNENIYNTNGTLTADRTVTMGNQDLEFTSDGVGDFIISDNGTNVFMVEGTDVGIGVTNPNHTLHIAEAGLGTAASATSGTIFLEHATPGGRSSIVFESAGNPSDYAYIQYSDDGSGNGSTSENGLLEISAQNDGIDGFQDDIAIMPSGAFGVGTRSPDAFFDVDGGTVRFSDYGGGTVTGTTEYILGVDADGDVIEIDPASIGGNNDNIYTTNGTLQADRTVTMGNRSLLFDGTATGDVIIQADGDVGIGTLAPSQKLHVAGAHKVQIGTFAGSTGGKLRVDIAASEAETQGIKTVIQRSTGSNYGVNATVIGAGATRNTGLYGWATGANENFGLHIDSGLGIFDDKVGVGTTTPDAMLDVRYNRNSSFTAPEPNDGLNAFLASIAAINTNNGDWSRALSSLTPNVPDGSKSGLITFGQGDDTRQAGHMYFVDTGADGDEYIGFSMRSGYTDIMSLTGNGDVGIGTTTPDAKLDVEGGTMRLSDYGGGTVTGTTTYVLGVDVDGDVIEIDPASLSGGGGGADNLGNHVAEENLQMTDFWISNDGDDEGIYVEADGDVGIGTDSPTGQFHAINDANVDGFLFESGNILTGERDVFTIIDGDVGGGGQDHSSVLKVQKSANINTGDDGFSLVELTYAGTDPNDGKYWISGRKTDEAAPTWGVNISDNQIWSSGGMLLNATGAVGGTYSGGDFIVEADGDVGIGTNSPARRLEVDGGSVRFSDYGNTPGTYESTANATYILGVESDGDVVEMNTAKNSRIFYPPAIAIVANTITPPADPDLSIDLHEQYRLLYTNPDIGSTGAPAAIPSYDEDELYYYITDYDTSVFSNVAISATGVMTYKVIAPATDDCSFINVVFVVK